MLKRILQVIGSTTIVVFGAVRCMMDAVGRSTFLEDADALGPKATAVLDWIGNNPAILFYGTLLLLTAAIVWSTLYDRSESKSAGAQLGPLIVISGVTLTIIGGLVWYIETLHTGSASSEPRAAKPEVKTSNEGEATEQPQIVLTGPEARHQLVWDPEKSNMILIAPDGQIRENKWTVPIFFLRSANTIAAQDATIEWQSNISSIADLTNAAKQLDAYKFTFEDDHFVISGPHDNVPNFTYNLKTRFSLPVPFISGASLGTKAHLPLDIFVNAMLYTIALMPDELGATIPPFTFSASVTWNLPSPGAQKFWIKAMAMNAKSPNVDRPKVSAFISFSIDKAD